MHLFEALCKNTQCAEIEPQSEGVSQIVHQVYDDRSSESQGLPKDTPGVFQNVHLHNMYNTYLVDKSSIDIDNEKSTNEKLAPDKPPIQSSTRISYLHKIPTLQLQQDQVKAYAEDWARRLNDEPGIKFYYLTAWHLEKSWVDQIISTAEQDKSVRNIAAIVNVEINKKAEAIYHKQQTTDSGEASLQSFEKQKAALGKKMRSHRGVALEQSHTNLTLA